MEETLQLNTGVRVPLVGFGTFKLRGEVCETAVAEALRCGYRLIDTAGVYKLAHMERPDVWS
jgi:2,5-diketo-D-gluconate reductase A